MKYKMSYVIANIRIPIKVNEDGTTTSLTNHSIISIEPCDELPPENGNQLLMIQESVKKYMQHKQQDGKNKEVQEKEEPEKEQHQSYPKKIGRNTTFKNYSSNNAHRLTMKRR